MTSEDLSAGVLGRMASYCAWRAHALATDIADLRPLQQMAEHNLQELKFDLPVKLVLQRAVTADGRMHPHEWLLTQDGQMLKTDSGSHGSDHFFPGATDIAWDLAGAIVEWQMDDVEADLFLGMYQRASGDDARLRIKDFIIAYAIFRGAYCLMAANTLCGSPEQPRMEQAAADYSTRLSTYSRTLSAVQ
jgi:hypothetical protein